MPFETTSRKQSSQSSESSKAPESGLNDPLEDDLVDNLSESSSVEPDKQDGQDGLYDGMKSDEDVYLKRTFKKNKSFGDVSDELAGLDHEMGSVGHNLAKQRKMAARTSLVMDEHVRKVNKYYAYVSGGAQATPKKAEEEQQAADKGTTELQKLSSSGGKSKDIAKLTEKVEGHSKEAARLKSLLPESKTRSAHLETWAKTDAVAADEVAELNEEALEREDIFKRIYSTKEQKGSELAPYLRRTRKFTAAFSEKMDRALAARKESSEHTRKGKVSYDWTTKNIGWQGWGKLILKTVGGLLASALVKTLTFGTVDVTSGSNDGGRTQSMAPSFASWIGDFKRVQAECAEIKKTGMAGGAKATKVYTFLKMLSGWFMPLVRDLSISLSLWGIILAPFTGGSSLAVTAVAGGVAFVTTAIKAVIELALLVWSSVRSVMLHDKHSRGYKVSKSEMMDQGGQLAGDLVTVGTTGMLGTNVNSGKMMAPEQVLESRFTEFGRTNPSVNFGGLDSDTVGNTFKTDVIDKGLDQTGLGIRTVGQMGVDGSMNLAGRMGQKELKGRDQRVKTGKTFDKKSSGPKAPEKSEVTSVTKRVNSGGKRLSGKFTELSGKVASASKSTDKTAPPEQIKDNLAVQSGMSEMSTVLEDALEIDLDDYDI